jgi:hypothetical protein
MNAARVFFVSSALLLIIPLGGMAQDKYIPKENEEIYGTWISTNLDHTGTQKIVVGAEGAKHYALLSDSDPYDGATMVIDSKWTDSEGNIWYKTHGTWTSGAWKGYSFVELDRLNVSNRIWEAQFTPLDPNAQIKPALYPEKFNPESSTHGVFYRYRAEQ